MTSPAAPTHGRDCRCTPCKAEDWNAVEAGLRAHRPADTIREAIRYVPKHHWILRDDALAALTELEQRIAANARASILLIDKQRERAEAAEADRDRLQARVDALHCTDCATPLECGLTVKPLCHIRAEAFQEKHDLLCEAIRRGEQIEADRDRLAADLELIRIGQWNTGTGKNLTAREFARAALDRQEVRDAVD